jgi:hypothetical protein
VTDYPVIVPGPTHDPDGVRLRHGGCTCGAVRFTLRGAPLVVGLCHCLECRKATGAVAMPYADWPKAAFRQTGDARSFNGRSFCPACGSRLFHIEAETVEIMLGVLDAAPGDLVPAQEGWTIRREHWLAPVVGARQSERNP